MRPLEPLLFRPLGQRDYQPVFAAMQAFTAARTDASLDELWTVEHLPVFTQGMAGKPEHLLAPGSIPVIPVDRGGQVTYHGPGQLVVYCLLDVRRLRLGVRVLVTALEQAVIELLASYRISAYSRPDAPGVYVQDAKIAALGLRIRQGRCYHGLSLNIHMDLEPFSRINPCGYPGLRVTQLKDLGIEVSLTEAADALLPCLAAKLGYTRYSKVEGQATPKPMI